MTGIWHIFVSPGALFAYVTMILLEKLPIPPPDFVFGFYILASIYTFAIIVGCLLSWSWLSLGIFVLSVISGVTFFLSVEE